MFKPLLKPLNWLAAIAILFIIWLYAVACFGFLEPAQRILSTPR